MTEAFMDTGDGHRVFYQVRGEPAAITVLFVHGGPGGGVQDHDRRRLEACSLPVVFVDQRGAGRSEYDDRLAANTTDDLIGDFETLRQQLGVERWILVGGSWGSTLSLAYAIAHPGRIERLVLHGIFLLRRDEIDWFYNGGAAHVMPDAYERYLDALPAADRAEPLFAYHRLLGSDDERTQLDAARAWARWEAVNSYLEPTDEQIAGMTEPRQALAIAQLETHYFVNGGFFGRDNYLIENARAIADVPTTIIHGRYDTICPLQSAWALHRALPASELRICPRASHDATEPQIDAALRQVLAKLGR